MAQGEFTAPCRYKFRLVRGTNIHAHSLPRAGSCESPQRSCAERNSRRKVMVNGFSRIHQHLINRDDVRCLKNCTTVTIWMFEIEINVFVKRTYTYLLHSFGLETQFQESIYLLFDRCWRCIDIGKYISNKTNDRCERYVRCLQWYASASVICVIEKSASSLICLRDERLPSDCFRKMDTSSWIALFVIKKKKKIVMRYNGKIRGTSDK